MSNLKKCVYKLHQNEIINKLLKIEIKEINKLYTRFNKQLKIYKNICGEKL